METYDSSISMDETVRNFGVQQTALTSFVQNMLSNPGA
jgi:hypothetical protein